MKATGSTVGYLESGATTGTPTLITSVVGLDLPEVSDEDIDVSTLDSATLKYHAGDTEPGEAKVTVIYGKTQYSALFALKGVMKQWTFTLPDSATQQGDGYIKSIKPGLDRKNGATYELSIKMSGPITFTAGA